MTTLTINGKSIKTQEGKTILEVARENDIYIPTLCYHDALSPAGNCRLCTVEVTQGKCTTLETSCNYLVQEGMAVKTDSERVKDVRQLVMELLLARCPNPKKIKEMAAEVGIELRKTICSFRLRIFKNVSIPTITDDNIYSLWII